MKIAIIGANGKIGSRITEEALNRGHSVTGIARHPEMGVQNDRVKWVKANALDSKLLAATISGQDAIISAFGIDWSRPETYPLFTDMSHSLLGAAKEAGVKRLLVVGGAGSLEIAPGVQLVDTAGFPETWRLGADEQRKSLNIFYGETVLEWTFFSPAIMIEPGPRTGKFRLGKDNPVFDEKGNSDISYDDYAMAMIDELENPRFIRQRFTIGY
jgi:uncharacterized protein